MRTFVWEKMSTRDRIAWVVIFPAFLVASLVGFHFYPIETLLVGMAGMAVRLTIIDYFVRRRRNRNGSPGLVDAVA